MIKVLYVVWLPLLGLLSWCPIFKSSHYNSFEDRAPVDFIYWCPIYKWAAEIRLRTTIPSMVGGWHMDRRCLHKLFSLWRREPTGTMEPTGCWPRLIQVCLMVVSLHGSCVILVKVESAWWLMMTGCLLGCKTSSTTRVRSWNSGMRCMSLYSLIMARANRHISGVPQHHAGIIMMTSSNGNIFRVTSLCAGNSPVTGEFPAQRPVTRSFDVFFELRLNKRSSKHSWGWWFETPLQLLCRHCNGIQWTCWQLGTCSCNSPNLQ